MPKKGQRPANPFPFGNKLSKGGARPGAGRKTDAFKAQMAKIASSKAAINFIEGAIKGKDVDEFLVLQTGVQVPVKADGSLKLKCIEFAAHYGYGKPVSVIEMPDGSDAGSGIVIMLPGQNRGEAGGVE